MPEEVLVEEPLEIRLDGDLVATTMRTPGHDFELAVGFCWAEGFISEAPGKVRYCATGSATDTGFNVVTVQRSPSDARTTRPQGRLGITSSSCGVCGCEHIDALTEDLQPLPPTPGLTSRLLVAAGSGAPRSQELFGVTGGSHAAAAIDLHGDPIVLREDIGRHNAVDKVVGSLLLGETRRPAGPAVPGDPGLAAVLWVSGRASFEILQKAWAAGFSAVVAVGAVSSLAVDTAERARIVLCGFAREGRVTVYAGEELLGALP